MKRRPSLTLRIIVYLFGAQLFAFTVGWTIVMSMLLAGLKPWKVTLDDFGKFRTRDLVIDSLVIGDDNMLRLNPTPDLQDEMKRVPTLKFAVFDPSQRRYAQGSSPDLIPALTEHPSIKMVAMDFFMADDLGPRSTGYLDSIETALGPIRLAMYGFRFRWDDPIWTLEAQLRDQSPYLVAAVLLSSVASWIAVRRGLIPLRAAAEGATRIDMNSLNQRLPDRDVPSEVMPLVGAVNDALIRLDAGSGRLRRFMANAAHELRTPLAILNARLSAPEEPTFKKDLKRDVRRARHIVEQLLATTRLGERSAEIIQGVDLAAAVKTVATDAAILAIKNRRRLEFDAPPAPVFVKANGPALESVVANLIDNALRAEPEGGTIIVRVIQDATVEVIDHGEGVAGDDREMIFEPFWRKSEATPGSGLGLAIAKELMETLGGRIWIEDTLGGGATFKLSFSRTGFI